MGQNSGCVGIVILMVVFGFCWSMMSRRPRPRPEPRPGPTSRAAAQAKAKIDLTDKLNPKILPDVVSSVLKGMSEEAKTDSEQFHKTLVQKLSKKIMEDPEVNYRVDLNEDKQIDPLLIVPESPKDDTAVYSLRVPDPIKNPKDPTPPADWDKLAEEGVELLALSLIFDPNGKKLTVDADPNDYVYENSRHHHYRSHYYHHHHSWLGGYWGYSLFRGGLGYHRPGGWYDGYYAGWHGPTSTRMVDRPVSSYGSSQVVGAAPRTPSGQEIVSQRAATRTSRPQSIQTLVNRHTARAARSTAQRTSSARRVSTSRSGRYVSTTRRSSRGTSWFRGRSGGWGK